MNITKEYLDGISFDTVKQKYYNANKVNACLSELISGVKELLDENERLCAENAELMSARTEISDVLLSAKQNAATIIVSANEEAQRIRDTAQKDAEELIIAAETVRCQQSSPLSEKQLAAIDDYNKQLDALNVSLATQVFRLKQSILKIASNDI